MAQEVPRPDEEIGDGRLVEGAENLVLIGWDASVAINAERTPRNDRTARDEEVSGEVEAMPQACGDKHVELLHLRRGEGDAILCDDGALVVVDANGVVADASEFGGEVVSFLGRFGKVGGAAEVHAVEALPDAG